MYSLDEIKKILNNRLKEFTKDLKENYFKNFKTDNSITNGTRKRGYGIGEKSLTTGINNEASGKYSSAIGANTEARGMNSCAQGSNTKAYSNNQHVEGQYNIPDNNNKFAHIVGNGDVNKASNAYTLDWEGNAKYSGSVKANGKVVDGNDLTTKDYVLDRIIYKYFPMVESENGELAKIYLSDLEEYTLYKADLKDKNYLKIIIYNDRQHTNQTIFTSDKTINKHVFFMGRKDVNKYTFIIDSYIYNIEIGDDLIIKVSSNNYLALDNTVAYIPEGNYNPSTKKYVDDTTTNKVNEEKGRAEEAEGTLSTKLNNWTITIDNVSDDVDILKGDESTYGSIRNLISEKVDGISSTVDDIVNNKLGPIESSLSGKQDVIDISLETSSKNVPGAINELNTKVKAFSGGAADSAHTHFNKEVLDTITQTRVNDWDNKASKDDLASVTIDSAMLEAAINKALENYTFTDHKHDAVDINYVNEDYNVSNLQQALDLLLYKELSISFTTTNATTLMLGYAIPSIAFKWVYNKDSIVYQTLDGATLDVSFRAYTYNQQVTANKTFMLRAHDGKKEYSKSISFSFVNSVFYGAQVQGDTYSTLLNNLSSVLSDSKSRTITVDCATNQYIYYAYPTRLGDAAFSVGGFSGGFTKVATYSYTNKYGYVENYNIYKSNNNSLGTTTITVS